MTVDQLAELTPWSANAIRRMVSRGTLKKGLHYHQPGGRKGRLVFDWEAVEAFIRGEEEPEQEDHPIEPTVKIFRRKEVKLDEEEAGQAARLLR